MTQINKIVTKIITQRRQENLYKMLTNYFTRSCTKVLLHDI